jgi:tetratricopeptide (TPR) repeat protein
MATAGTRNAAGTTTPSKPALWILSPVWDLVLFVGTPLLILPAMWAAQQRFRLEEIALFVASFGALGHHMPGMIRAYGDRALFQRFKVRFIVAPIFLAVVCTLFTVMDLSGIVLAVYLWGVWHGLMQTYGFTRIYDSKVKSFANITSRLDHMMCLTWFGGAVVLSDTRASNVLNTFYTAGGPLLPATWVTNAQHFALGALVLVNVLFFVNIGVQWRRGTPPSPIKLALMMSSFGFWWYANVFVTHMLVGIALFEIFHDVQYLSIVWLYNRKRAAQAEGELGSFARFLFRRSGSLVGLYVGLVFAYGALNYVARGVPMENLQRILMGLLLASALLHFYYDGFIWKVREKSTRESLGLEGGTGERSAGWMLHGLRWSFFLVPLFWLGAMEVRGAAPAVDRARAVASAIPNLAGAQYNLGVELAESGAFEEAREQYERALKLQPDFADAHYNLANLLLQEGALEEAVWHYREVAQLDPESATAHSNLGNALLQLRRPEEAVAAYRNALQIDPTLPKLHGNLGNAWAAMGEVSEAVEQYRQAVLVAPLDSRAHYNLARGLISLGKPSEALGAYREAVLLDPDFAEARFNLANALSRKGDQEGAATHYRAALLLAPDPETHLNLGNTLAALGHGDEAIIEYQNALRLRPDFAAAHYALGVGAFGQGQLETAIASFREAIRLQPDHADAHHNLGVALVRSGRREEGERSLAEAKRY